MGPVQIERKAVSALSTGDVFLRAGRKALGLEEGKGPLKWATFGDYLKDEWQRVARDYGSTPPFGEFWEAALRRGRAWRHAAAPAGTLRPGAGRGPPPAATLPGARPPAPTVHPPRR